MYRITWHDKDSGQNKELRVHTIRAVRDVTATLARQQYRYSQIAFTRMQSRRVREIVIEVS